MQSNKSIDVFSPSATFVPGTSDITPLVVDPKHVWSATNLAQILPVCTSKPTKVCYGTKGAEKCGYTCPESGVLSTSCLKPGAASGANASGMYVPLGLPVQGQLNFPKYTGIKIDSKYLYDPQLDADKTDSICPKGTSMLVCPAGEYDWDAGTCAAARRQTSVRTPQHRTGLQCYNVTQCIENQ